MSDDSEGEENKVKMYTRKGEIATGYNPYARNKDYYDDDKELKEELEFTARFMVEQAPSYEGGHKQKSYKDMLRMTKQEKSQI